MTPAYWQQACAELAATCSVMAELVARYPASVLRTRGEPFETLLRAIVGQQISIAAADAIWARLAALLDTTSPAAVAAVAPDALRACGFSQRKVEYAQDLAQHFLDGRIQPAQFDALDDEAIIRELVAVRGIGRWTAEMYLIFNLCRPDVWPVDDIGLQKALVQIHGLDARPALAVFRQMGERYRPWRSVATWYLWRMLDPVEVQY
ncbi:DNA-3-methyladenine glycosylase II [Vogesella perlucida]|nr:DNA-3-methyladenine glycosylase II [Vogesella perlucida]